MRPLSKGRRGIALIEALVALAVMAFGLLSVAGLQVVLRQNADAAKQRSEAVRLAQEEIERWRGYQAVTGPVGAVAYYNNLQPGPNPAVNGSNTSFTLTRTVAESTTPAYKTLSVDVAWSDRSGAPQTVRLSTTLVAVAPELAATVSVVSNGLPAARPRGRILGIPLEAVPLSPTTSGFKPPQGTSPGEVWVFNNLTGLITICVTTATSTEGLTLDNITGCDPNVRAQLLSGFVNFATEPGAAPTAAQAEEPPSGSEAVSVQVERTRPSPATVSCFVAQRTLYVAYYCAVPVSPVAADLPVWSGRALVGGLATLTDNLLAAAPTGRRVCRYTRYRDDRAVGPAPEGMTNAEHPRDYVNVGGPLPSQNYLVIRAGDGSLAFDCPADNTPTPVDSTTWHHPLTLS